MAIRSLGVLVAVFVIASCCCLTIGQQQPDLSEGTVDDSVGGEPKPSDEYYDYDEGEDASEDRDAGEGEQGTAPDQEGNQESKRGSKQLYQVLYPYGASPPSYPNFVAQPVYSGVDNVGSTVQQSGFRQGSQAPVVSAVPQDPLLQLLSANSVPSQGFIPNAAVPAEAANDGSSSFPQSAYPNGAFLVIPENLEEYRLLLELSKQSSASLGAIAANDATAIKASADSAQQSQFSGFGATKSPVEFAGFGATKSPVEFSGFGATKSPVEFAVPAQSVASVRDAINIQDGNQAVPIVQLPVEAPAQPSPAAASNVESRNGAVFIPVQAPIDPQQSRTFITGLSSLIPSFSLPSLIPTLSFDATTNSFTWNKPTLGSWLPANALSTIVDGADVAGVTATTVGGQMFFLQGNSLLPTTVTGVITGLTAGRTYNVQVFTSGDVSGGACANVQTLYTTGGLTGIIAQNQSPVGGSITILQKVATTAMTLRGTNSALTRSVVIVDTATQTKVGCGTITGF